LALALYQEVLVKMQSSNSVPDGAIGEIDSLFAGMKRHEDAFPNWRHEPTREESMSVSRNGSEQSTPMKWTDANTEEFWRHKESRSKQPYKPYAKTFPGCKQLVQYRIKTLCRVHKDDPPMVHDFDFLVNEHLTWKLLSASRRPGETEPPNTFTITAPDTNQADRSSEVDLFIQPDPQQNVQLAQVAGVPANANNAVVAPAQVVGGPANAINAVVPLPPQVVGAPINANNAVVPAQIAAGQAIVVAPIAPPQQANIVPPPALSALFQQYLAD